MEQERIQIHGVPALLWGPAADKLYLYLHGQGGSKEEAALFAALAVPRGWQVLSVDLPEHGERRGERDAFDPWHVVPELRSVMEYAKSGWPNIALFANSIGAWFGMLSFRDEGLTNCLFVSPVVDMARLIADMMTWANVSEERLEREGKIPTNFGQTLSWDYLQYARQHPVTKWAPPTEILYGERDDLTELEVIRTFSHRFRCGLTVMPGGEHWFHTPEQLYFLREWVSAHL